MIFWKTDLKINLRNAFCVLLHVGADGPGSSRGDKIRVFRAEKSYAVTQGKWYFEFEAVTVGEMRVGWARPSVRADTELGADELAYVFNGFKVGAKPSLCASSGFPSKSLKGPVVSFRLNVGMWEMSHLAVSGSRVTWWVV